MDGQNLAIGDVEEKRLRRLRHIWRRAECNIKKKLKKHLGKTNKKGFKEIRGGEKSSFWKDIV